MPDIESTRKALEEGQLPPEGMQPKARPAPEETTGAGPTASDLAIERALRGSCPFCGKQMRANTPAEPFVCEGCRFTVPREVIQDQNREVLTACIRMRFAQLAEVAGRACAMLEEMAPLIAGGRPSLLWKWGKQLRHMADEAEMRGPITSGVDRHVWTFVQAFDWLAAAMVVGGPTPAAPSGSQQASQQAQRARSRAAAGPGPPAVASGGTWGSKHLKATTGGQPDAVLQFGEHQGQKVSDMVRGEPGNSYLHWILSDPSFQESLKVIIRRWISLTTRNQP